jgi:lipid II:glycine glycyltransferase (peptidoglycan interpeptide bridge formation enzyme)
MKQKTRYNIRLARRKGIVIRQTSDIESFHQLIQITGERETFGVHSQAYYQQAFDLFEPKGHCALLMAEFEEKPLAGLMVFAQGERAWYFYGASSNEQRHLMPTYLLQWKAIQWAKEQGCTTYDLWGVPDEDQETLEANFLDRNDGLWGVYRFKRGFGGELRRAAPAWDRVYNPLIYRLYLWRIGKQSSALL